MKTICKEISIEELKALASKKKIRIQLAGKEQIELKYNGPPPKAIVHIYDGIVQSMVSDITLTGIVIEEDKNIGYDPDKEEIEFSERILEESNKMKDALFRKTFVGHL